MLGSGRALTQEGHPLSAVAVSLVLRQEGFARLPRRQDEERPPGTRPDAAAVANELRTSPEGAALILDELFVDEDDRLIH